MLCDCAAFRCGETERTKFGKGFITISERSTSRFFDLPQMTKNQKCYKIQRYVDTFEVSSWGGLGATDLVTCLHADRDKKAQKHPLVFLIFCANTNSILELATLISCIFCLTEGMANTASAISDLSDFSRILL